MGADDQREPGAHHHYAGDGAWAGPGARVAGGRAQPLHRRPRAGSRTHSAAGEPMTLAMSPDTVLEVRNLSVAYRQGGGWSRAVDDVSFALKQGEVFGLVGESG